MGGSDFAATRLDGWDPCESDEDEFVDRTLVAELGERTSKAPMEAAPSSPGGTGAGPLLGDGGRERFGGGFFGGITLGCSSEIEPCIVVLGPPPFKEDVEAESLTIRSAGTVFDSELICRECPSTRADVADLVNRICSAPLGSMAGRSADIRASGRTSTCGMPGEKAADHGATAVVGNSCSRLELLAVVGGIPELWVGATIL